MKGATKEMKGATKEMKGATKERKEATKERKEATKELTKEEPFVVPAKAGTQVLFEEKLGRRLKHSGATGYSSAGSFKARSTICVARLKS
jgi:hypothetical protein